MFRIHINKQTLLIFHRTVQANHPKHMSWHMYGATPVWDTRDAKAWKTTRPLITCLLWSAIPCGMQRLLLLMGLCVWLCGCVLMMQLWCWWCHIYVRQVLYGIAFCWIRAGWWGDGTRTSPSLNLCYRFMAAQNLRFRYPPQINASNASLKNYASRSSLQDAF